MVVPSLFPAYRRLVSHILRALALVGALAPRAVAQTSASDGETTTPIFVALYIESPSECVQAEGVYAAVTRRSSRIRFANTAEHAVELAVNPGPGEPAQGSWHANVELVRAGTRERSRSLEAQDCASLVEAIGFIIALTFDPPSTARPEPPPAVEAPPDPKPAPSPTTWQSDHSPPDLTQSTPTRTQVHFNVAFEVVSEAGPLLLPGVGLGVHVASEPTPGFNPSFAGHLQVSAFPGRSLEQKAGVARFRLLTGRLSLCPLALHTGVFTLRPCASGTWGALNAKGTATSEPRDHTRPWGSLGGGLWAGVNATNELRIDLDAGVGMTLVRDAFQFEPDIFHRTSDVSVRVALGLSLLLN